MNVEPIRAGGILAAGEGSRLRHAGWEMPKPLVPVAGVPLIGHVIENFLAAGIRTLDVIFNEDGEECVRWVRSRFPELDLRIVVKTTRSSLQSFREIAARSGAGRVLFSTADAFCPRTDFLDFVREAERTPAEATVLAVTPLVADERPLWVSLDGSGRITTLGGGSGELVTAGMYLVSERVRRIPPPRDLGSLREFLAWLLAQGETLYGVRVSAVVDVDRAEDVALAEALERGEALAGRVRGAR